MLTVCCVDTGSAHVVGRDALAPLERLALSADEVCDERRAAIGEASLAYEDEGGIVLRGGAAMAALEARCGFSYVETLAFLHERHLRQRSLLFFPPLPSPRELFGSDDFAPGVTAALLVKPTPPVGLGVFAGADLPARCFVAEYAALVRPPRTADAGYDGFMLEYGESLGGESLHLSALEFGNVGRFFNHDDAALQNADLAKVCDAGGGLARVVVVTRAAIPAGDQILVDYGKAYWQGAPFRPVPATPR